MDADYDPRVPNDYNDFKALLRKRREAMRRQRIEQEAEEALRRAGGYPGQDRLSEGSDEASDDDYRHRKMGRFAPPAIYRSNSSTMFVQNAPSTDDWTATEDDEKPYLSPPPRLPLGPLPGPGPGLSPSVPAPIALSGEEAYQRRVALSQASTVDEAHQDRRGLSHHTTSQPEPAESSQVDQKSEAPDFAARAAAAAAIAARLAKAAPTESVALPQEATSSVRLDPATFAERLMMKQGWKKGEALGAEGNKGILDPILAQKVEMERTRLRNDQSGGGSGNGHDSNSTGTRGTLVNALEDERRREYRQRYGEPSEVILLEDMIAGDEDIDDELPGEIGEECAKHGYVERVFIWPASSCQTGKPRIFVKFSGMAGAWRCLKELDGRFFAGNTVTARYYPSSDFSRGHYDLLNQ